MINSRRKVQKLRDQSQYISKKVRALQDWRWACGTCCKQYHMLFYIQMAVVSTTIFFLFSPSFSFFLEIKVQIYIYIHNKCQYINQFPPNFKFTELRRNQYPPPHVPRVITPPIPSNATKIGNPTSQCVLLGLKLVQLSTLAGRIFFGHSWKSSDGVRTELIRSLYAPSLRIYSVYTPSPLRPNFSTCDKKKSYQPVCSIGPISSP